MVYGEQLVVIGGVIFPGDNIESDEVETHGAVRPED